MGYYLIFQISFDQRNSSPQTNNQQTAHHATTPQKTQLKKPNFHAELRPAHINMFRSYISTGAHTKDGRKSGGRNARDKRREAISFGKFRGDGCDPESYQGHYQYETPGCLCKYR